MATDIEQLLILQDRDRRILQLSREQTDIPLRRQQIESRLDAHREGLNNAREELKKRSSAIRQIEIEIDTRKQKITRLREQEFQIKSNTEYRALEHEIEVLQKEIRGQEDREIAVMEEMESLRADVQQREQDMGRDQQHVAVDLDALTQRECVIAREISALQAERAELAATVQPDWLSRYERVFQRAGDYAVVPVEHVGCGGCHMKLPPSVIHEARRNTLLTTCNFCGRILYNK